MEVHHHPHAEKKGFKEYFLEFLMIFLAVTLGFLAENIRENIIEVTIEHEYVKSFYEDLTADEKDLQKTINYLDKQASIADSLSILMNNISTTQPANLIYIYLRSITRSTFFNVNDRTIIQLRNAGGMRLIKNKSVSDSMVSYYKEVDYLSFLFAEALNIKKSLREKSQPLLNAGDFARVIDSNSNNIINPSQILYLRSVDPEIINKCLIEINNIRGISSGTKNRIQRLQKRASRIKIFIEKEYNLK
ncbi:MAG TPA: hypothetical protein VET23_05355 [Chitinophagaceae bacterium]|nr:hypothetical protein [Chitinophagaceae bacterium]